MAKTHRNKASSLIDNPVRTYGILIVLAVGLYANTLGHQYTLDDAIVITDNMFTTEGIAGIPGIFSHDTFYGFFREEGKSQLVSGGRYRPLSLFLFALLWEFFGHAPWSGHLLNVLVYAGLACLIFGTLQSWFKRLWSERRAKWTAWLTAIFFVVHPIHTEVVANIKGLDEQLSLAGGLGALWFIRKYLDGNRSHGTLALAVACLLLGILSKENALMFAGIIPLSIVFFQKGSLWPKKANSVLFWMIGGIGVYAFIRFYLVGLSPGGGAPMELMNNPFIKVVDGAYIPFTTGEWLATVSVGLWTYLRLLLFPHPLTHDYYPRHIEVYDFGDVLPWFGLLSHLALAVLAVSAWPRRKWYAIAIAWYLVSLFIYSNIPVNLGAHLSERFLFTPSLAFALLLAVVSRRLHNRFALKGPSLLAWSVPVMLILVMSVKTIDRNAVWKNNFILFTTDVKTSKRSAKLRNAVGGEYTTTAGRKSETSERKSLASKAIPHLKVALDIHPRYKNAWLLLGNANFYLDRFEQAVGAYRNALDIDPDYEEAGRNLRLAYRDGGRYFGEQTGDLKKSKAWLRKAYQMDPTDYETIRLLGVAYGMSGQNDRALQFFKKAVEQRPDDANALYNLGTAYFNAGKQDSANIYRQRALRIDPDIANRNRSSQ